MSRLYDRAQELGFLPPGRKMQPGDGHLREVLPEAQVIAIDNVAEYYWQHSAKWADPKELPNTAPPFPVFFMECDTSRSKYSAIPNARAVGVLFEATDGGGGWEIEVRNFLRGYGLNPDALRWLVFATVFLELNELNGKVAAPCVRYSLMIDPDGTLMEIGSHLSGYDEAAMEDQERAALERTGIHCFLMPALLAVGFMHCKNVSLRTEEPPAKLNRARSKRGKPPLVRFHTLEIEPMKQILKHEGQVEKTGLRQALHLCRGHFKDYRASGLFGRHKGLYWWDAHVRGSATESVVMKDYSISVPSMDQAP